MKLCALAMCSTVLGNDLKAIATNVKGLFISNYKKRKCTTYLHIQKMSFYRVLMLICGIGQPPYLIAGDLECLVCTHQ